MLDILLIVVIGGMGTIYGAIIGAALFILAQNYLQELMGAAANAAARPAAAAAATAASRPLAALARPAVHASVYFFPTGVVGRLRNTGRKPT